MWRGMYIILNYNVKLLFFFFFTMVYYLSALAERGAGTLDKLRRNLRTKDVNLDSHLVFWEGSVLRLPPSPALGRTEGDGVTE